MLKVLNRIYQREMKILSVKSDAILWPVSEDGLSSEKLGIMLTNLYPELNRIYMDRCLDETLKKGKIFFFNKVTPAIIVAPFKNSCTDPYNDEYILEFVKKLNDVKEKINIETISIEKSKLTDEQINILVKNKNFKIKLFQKEIFLQEI
jgi:hypothetical protein